MRPVWWVHGLAFVLLVAACGDNIKSAQPVGGTVTGLQGMGLILRNNGGDDLIISGDGSFAFKTPIQFGGTYEVTVQSQPSAPTQTCSVTNGSGKVETDAPVTNIEVTCQTGVFTIGGTVSGLQGSGLVLQDNAGDDLAISANGTFTFATPVASGQPFAVTVKTQPGNPTQTCTVGGGAGTVGAGNVTTVVVDCATDKFMVGGTVTGLDGSVVLQNNGGDDITVTANGTFAFPTTVSSGASYAVTVLTNPSSPVAQTCTVTNGSGTVGGSDVTDVHVDCTTNTYSVSGSVSGLAGSGLVLQDNGGDDLAISANGAFTFTTAVASGTNYAVTVLSQPSGPTQNCVVTNGSGTIGNADVTNVSIVCTTVKFTIGGTVSGLAGSGLVLQDNGGDNLSISANGTFTFATPIDSGTTYAVTVLSQPTGPSQTCVVTNGSGTVGGGNVTDVIVTCTTNPYTIGGTVTGLVGSGLVLRDNGGDDLAVSADGTFTFATPVLSGQTYDVTVAAQPTGPSQTCTVSGGSGIVGGGNVTSVMVNCTTNRYTIGGTISGLGGGTVVLHEAGGEDLPVSANGSYAFMTTIISGGSYTVTVKTQPTSPWQTCTVANGSGTVTNANVTNINVTCTTNTYSIGGTVSGLASGESVVLRNNGGDQITVSGTTFTFPTKIASGATYAVTVQTQPTSPISQTCTVTNGGGTVAGADVTNVSVTCTTNKFTIGGTVSNLVGTGLVLRNNGGDDLAITANGSFTFSTPIASGATYNVTVRTQPNGQVCNVTNGSGTVGNGNVTSVSVACTNGDGVVIDVAGVAAPVFYTPCGDGTNTNCIQTVAEASCAAIGKRLVSHASLGTPTIVSLGATASCFWSISYFTNLRPAVAGQCLIGISNAGWNNCCSLTQWHGNVVTVPSTTGQQFGYTSPNDTGFNGSLSNVSGNTWGCQPTGTPPPARSGCGTYYVACK